MGDHTFPGVQGLPLQTRLKPLNLGGDIDSKLRLLIDALELGGPGCISATANLNMGEIAKVVELYDQGDIDAAREQQERISGTRLTIQHYGPIPAQKRLLAMRTGDERWVNVRPPLTALPESLGRELANALRGEQ